MQKLAGLFKWIVRAAIFLALLVFALDNQQSTSLRFLRFEWNAPLVLILLVAFALGLALGVLVMVPRWLSQRRAARRARRENASDSQLDMSTQFPPSTHYPPSTPADPHAV